MLLFVLCGAGCGQLRALRVCRPPACRQASGGPRGLVKKQQENLSKSDIPTTGSGATINREKLLSCQDGSLLSGRRGRKQYGAKYGRNAKCETIPLHNFHSLPCKTPSLFSVPYIGFAASRRRLRLSFTTRCQPASSHFSPVTQHRCE